MAFSGPSLCLVCALVAAPPVVVPRDLPSPDDLRFLKANSIPLDVRGDTIFLEDATAIDALPAKRLAAMRWIRRAVIHRSESIEAIDVLSGLPNLEYLACRGERFRTEHFQRVGRVRGLQTLAIRGSDVRADDLSCLGELEYLKSLELDGTFVGVNYGVLAELPRLRFVSLTGPGIDDGVAAAVGRSKSITSVRLSGADLTDDGVRAITRATQLRSLTLIDAPDVTNASIRGLGELPRLETLELPSIRIDDHGLDELLRLELPELRHLSLARTKISAEGVVALAAGEFRLETLDLSGIPLDRRAIRALARLSTVRLLHLSNCGLNDESIAPLATMTGLAELDILSNQVTDKQVVELKRAIPGINIRYLTPRYHIKL
jgi:hypothetical protein